jgi:hypothetical protein
VPRDVEIWRCFSNYRIPITISVLIEIGTSKAESVEDSNTSAEVARARVEVRPVYPNASTATHRPGIYCMCFFSVPSVESPICKNNAGPWACNSPSSPQTPIPPTTLVLYQESVSHLIHDLCHRQYTLINQLN